MRGRTRHKVAGAGFEAWLDSTQVRTSTLGDINEDNSTTLPYDPEPQYPSDMWDHDSTIQPGEQEIDADERLSPSDSLDFDSAPERPYPGPNPDLFAKDASAANLGPKFASWLLEAAPEGDDSISRFKRDPIQEINRLGYLWTGGVEEPEMAEYGRLVEADKQLRTAAWNDVRQKAQRLRREGRVHVLHKAPGNIYANVDGDHGTYSVLINKVSFNSQTIDKWACSCEWGKWAFQRKISYVGRLCSHGYASYLEMQSDQHKGNPGRFVHPFDPGVMSPRKRKTSSCVDGFQDYVEDYRDGHVDIDAADSYISLPSHDEPFAEDEVDEIYDWARENRTEREPRDYKQHYTAAESSDGTKVLRTQPGRLTPDLVRVPGPQPSYFVDVEEDERETTGPGQTVLSMVDAQGNRYTPANLWRTADEMAPEDESGGTYSPDVATPRVPDSAPQSMEEETNPSSSLGSGFSMSDFSNVAGPVIDGVSQFAAPIAEGIGSAIGGIFSSRRTAEYYMDGPTNDETPTGEIDHLRELSDEEPDYRNRDTQNRGVRDAVEYLREQGYDASPIVARRNASHDSDGQDAAPPGAAYWQPGGRANGFSGSGADEKLWRSTSQDLLDRGDEDIDEIDVTEGEGETNHWDESDRPAQGKSARRRYAAAEGPASPGSYVDEMMVPEQRTVGNADKLPNWQGPPAPGETVNINARRRYADEEEVRNNLIQSVGEEIEGIGLYSDFLDDAEDAGDDDAADAIEETIRDEYKHVDQFSDALERQGGMNDVVRRFQASGGGALAGDNGGGNYGDDAIAGQARKFLAKTAGRVYSLAEQQELVDEIHPNGARNKPTEDDLAGTHYV
jgi:ferritin-like metal-binding protein YciE